MTRTTKIIIGATVLIWAVYDLVAYNAAGNDATISVVIHQFAKDWPIATLGFGVLLGHWFWPLKETGGVA